MGGTVLLIDLSLKRLVVRLAEPRPAKRLNFTTTEVWIRRTPALKTLI